jgi:hypothetical protein
VDPFQRIKADGALRTAVVFLIVLGVINDA